MLHSPLGLVIGPSINRQSENFVADLGHDPSN
jgi:hypothetical protein